MLFGDDVDAGVKADRDPAAIILFRAGPDFPAAASCDDGAVGDALKRHHGKDARCSAILPRPCDGTAPPPA